MLCGHNSELDKGQFEVSGLRLLAGDLGWPQIASHLLLGVLLGGVVSFGQKCHQEVYEQWSDKKLCAIVTLVCKLSFYLLNNILADCVY